MEGYINYVSAIVENDVYQRIRYQVDMKKNKALGEYNLDMKRAENAYRINLERLQYALQIARAAGLKGPLWGESASNQDDPDFPVMLGADGLDRKLKIVQSIADPTMLNADLQNRKLYIEKINQLEINSLSLQPFKYMRVPVEPIQPDGTKRSLIVLLAAIAGLIAGCGYVLLSTAVRQPD